MAEKKPEPGYEVQNVATATEPAIIDKEGNLLTLPAAVAQILNTLDDIKKLLG